MKKKFNFDQTWPFCCWEDGPRTCCSSYKIESFLGSGNVHGNSSNWGGYQDNQERAAGADRASRTEWNRRLLSVLKRKKILIMIILKLNFFILHYLQQATCYLPKILKVGQAVKANFSNNCPSGNPKIYFLHLDQ